MEFNINPYYDDFEQNAKDNNYLRILFKPGYSVQARELTQIQSILQNQIKSFGDHIFQDGSPVIGGNLTLDNKISYLKLEETYNNEDIEVADFSGKIILRDSDSGVQAKVLATYYPSGESPTLMIKYISGLEFTNGDVIKIAGTSTKARVGLGDATGKGTVVSINEGIFYVNGFFVKVGEQTTTVAPYSQNANVKIGLEISSDVVDYVVDSTLLDPAQGSFNYQAPGADRYQFNLDLSTRPLTTAIDESSFFELMRVENGVVTKQVKYPIYSEIEKTLARRTFDESGDYTVVPFAASVSAAPNANNYIINIDPGKAYVKGFEFETIGTYKLTADKPREVGIDTRRLVDYDVDVSYGSYLKFKNFKGNLTLDIKAMEQVDLHLVPSASINIGGQLTTANTFNYANTKIGTARVRNIQRDSYSIDTTNDGTFDSNGLYRLYLTDINIQPKVLRIPEAGANSKSINLSIFASNTTNAYQNVTVTCLPISLTEVPNVNTANVFAGSTRINANSAVANTVYDPTTGFANVGFGTVIRVGDETRRVVNIGHDATHGNYLIVNTAFTKTIVGTNKDSNPLRIFKQADITSNVINQTRTIVDYNGHTRIAVLDRDWDESARAAVNTVVQLNYSIKDLESFVEGNVSAGQSNTWADVSIMSKLINGDTELFDAGDKPLIFRMPNEFVMRGSLNNIDYTTTKYIPYEEITGTDGSFTVSLGADSSLPWSITDSNIEDNLIVVLREGNNQSTNPNGSILRCTTANVSSACTGINGSLTITTGSAAKKIDVYVNVKKNDVQQSNRIRTKTLRSNTDHTLSPFNYPTSATVGTIDYTVNSPHGTELAKINVNSSLIWITNPGYTNVGPGDAISLFVPDVVKIRKILKGTDSTDPTSGSYTDITDHFTVDYGQTDEMYDHAKIILKQGYPSPNARIVVHADFFTHTYPATYASFFSVDSYASGIYDNGEIPIYASPKTGVYYLRDCLDFRPTRQIGVTTGALQNGYIPQPDSSAESSFDYYLPRIDKLVLTKNKEFKIVKGVSSPSPVPPVDLTDAMTLYTIYLPPYASSTKDIRMKYHENRRYTMRDIARIEDRIKAIEYYTSLNNIENMAMNDSVQYLTDGTEKEKYGLVGEGFANYNIADFKNPDFTVALSPGMMVPATVSKVHGLKSIDSTNVQQNEKTLTLSYTEVPAITQNVTSNKLISVQPFLFASFVGDVKLTPEVDFWVSESLSPEVIRGPEVTTIVTEIKTTEVIKETIIEKTTVVTVPTPVTNAESLISTTSGSDPAAPTEEDEKPVETAADPAVIVPGAVETALTYDMNVLDPIVYLPTTVEYVSDDKIDYWGLDSGTAVTTPLPTIPESSATCSTITLSSTNKKTTYSSGW